MKKIIGFLWCTLFLISGAFTENSSVSDSIENLTDDFSEILIENSSLLGNQPDAFIGKVFPSIPPHFTTGLSVSGTLIDTDFICKTVKEFTDAINDDLGEYASVDFDFSLPAKLPLPSAAISARLGGFVLPFDIGIYGITSSNILNGITFDDFKAGVDYTTLGADFRYAIVQGNALLPKISIGAGYFYSKFGFNLDVTKTFSTTISGDSYESTLTGNMDMNLSNHTLFAEAQISKKLLIFTPYAGAKLMFTKTDSDYEWNYATETPNLPEEVDFDISDGDKNSSTGSFDKFSPQVFGGIGMQLGFIQMTFNASYNFASQYVSGGVGLNFKM